MTTTAEHTLPTIDCPPLSDKLYVNAWVYIDDDQLEAMQSLVAKWRPPDHWPGFAAFDATETDGLPSRGYFGAVFDGRYVYFVPEQHGEIDRDTHGVVLRYDTHGDFHAADSYAAYDAGHTDGLETRGYYGGAFDGRYVYFVPRQLGMITYHSHLLRYDTHGDFKSADSWSAYDIGVPHSHQSAAFDGRYLYLCPGFHGDPKAESDYSGVVIRCDTQGAFKDASSYVSLDISTLLGDEAKCFDGGAFDGRYIYLVPLYDGVAVRYDTHRDFESPTSWEKFDAKPLGYELSVGAVFDGRYMYYCAYAHSKIVRYDTRAAFTDAASWQVYDADYTNGIRTTGFDGGFFDGRFVYFQPFFLNVGPGKRDNQFHSHYLRYDTSKLFDDPTAWQGFDASRTDGLHSVGYNAGAFDGRYFYAAPWQQGPKPDKPDEVITHGIVLRCDTLGEHGSFSLRWCDYGHNGGLNAATPGPSFLVNTDHGVFSASAHRSFGTGWHHVAGTYDGNHVRLFVDGACVTENAARGRIIECDNPVVLGNIADGSASVRGMMKEAMVQDWIFTDTEIRAIAAGLHKIAPNQPAVTLEMDTYTVLDHRTALHGKVLVKLDPTSFAALRDSDQSLTVALSCAHRDTDQWCWRAMLELGDVREEMPVSFSMPVSDLAGGYYRLRAELRRGDTPLAKTDATIAVAEIDRDVADTSLDCLAFVTDTVDKLLSHQSRRLGNDPDGTMFITVSRPTNGGYRSLGHKKEDSDDFVTYWFPEQPAEHDTFRLDYEMLPLLDELSRLTGDPRYADMVTDMINAFMPHGFDEKSGLLTFSEESDFDVVNKRCVSRKGDDDLPHFKPNNGGNRNSLPLDRLWRADPDRMHRHFKSIYYGLITHGERMDFNRFCMYGYDDSRKRPSLTSNANHCAFETAAAQMIHWWGYDFLRTGDTECLAWAQKMTDKWRAVQDVTTGLMPNFFGAAGWQPFTPQQPGQWCETRGAALAAPIWIRASIAFEQHDAGKPLAAQLCEMGVRAARGVARFAWRPDTRSMREHLALDGSPYEATARYTFRTQEEKDRYVARDPLYEQVKVYDGAGLFEPAGYWDHFAGTNIPWRLTEAADLSRDAELIALIEPIAEAIIDESRRVTRPLTDAGNWTFRATGQYIMLLVTMARLTGREDLIDAAREMADAEIAALAQVKCPDWWRLPERCHLIDGLLMLANATAQRK